MRIAIAREADAGEPRVAATPETVKKFTGLGAEVAVEAGAGAASRHPRRRLRGRRRDRSRRPAATLCATPTSCSRCAGRPTAKLAALQAAARWSSASWIPTATRRRSRRWPTPGVVAFAMELMPRITRAQVMDVLSLAGQSRRLSRGDRRGGRVRPRLADDDDRGRHGAGGARLRHGRRRRRPAGDRDRAPARRRRHRDRRAPGRQGAGRDRSAPSSSRSRTRSSSRPRPPPATPRRCRRNTRRSRPRWSPSTSPSRTSSSPRR